jgi:aspartate ammonia-lyase
VACVTFSIVARDGDSFGVAVASKFLAAGAYVPAVEASVGAVTALVPLIGYEAAAQLAKEALASGRTVRALAREKFSLSDAALDEMLNPARLAAATG